MSATRPGRGPWRTPQRTPHEYRCPVAVRQRSRDSGDSNYELEVSPGAGVPELVAAAATLPRGVVFTGHRPAAPGGQAVVLVFQLPPAGPGDLDGSGRTPARPSPGGGPPPAPSPVPSSVPVPVPDEPPLLPEWVVVPAAA